MKTINSQVLLENLMSDVRKILLEAEKLKSVDQELLQKKPSESRWSVAQVLSHLNFYSRFYLNAIEEKLHRHGTVARETFTAGWFGNYFTNMMKPANEFTIKNKMKTMKAAVPETTVNGRFELQQFIADQHRLLNLLELSRTADIGKLRIPTSLTKFITLKLGDTYQFFIAHEQRHFVQISNTFKEIPKPAVV